MDIGTVNFEDLFDFSPEPHDRDNDASRGSLAERERETYRLNGEWPPHQQGQARGNPSQTGDNEMIVKQLWEELPDAEAAELSRSLENRRGRKGSRSGDVRVKLERSRQSARECRARKKLRYQYLDDSIAERERANDKLRNELVMYVAWCRELDMGRIPEGFDDFMQGGGEKK
eukprot:GFUD01011933.1.p1 GENE.GFUD01011933.1~~GFUD01011933.1.p1  ORF type:complete len:173 (-),score=52.44 GFUD01011933.1:174-692(-)